MVSSIDPYVLNFVILCVVVLLLDLISRYFNQPTVVTYILAGIVVGPFFLKFIADPGVISNLGNLGIILLLFFLGMEIHLPTLLSQWKITLRGTLLQILLSIGVMFLFGKWLNWHFTQVFFFGFVISISSTAVLIKILEKKHYLNTPVGNQILGILLVQDLMVVPMIILFSFMTGDINPMHISLQIVGTILIFIFVYYLLKKKSINLPFKDKIRQDPEIQLLVAFVICFGFALLTGLFQLSTALGAFLGGIFISMTKETQWIMDKLHSFKLLFISLFFVSIGLLIDVDFLMANIGPILGIVIIILLIKTGMNTLIFYWLGNSVKYSLYVGVLLSQIGEFSFLLAMISLESNFISESGYQLLLSVISLSLLLSPFYISMMTKWLEIDENKIVHGEK